MHSTVSNMHDEKNGFQVYLHNYLDYLQRVNKILKISNRKNKTYKNKHCIVKPEIILDI